MKSRNRKYIERKRIAKDPFMVFNKVVVGYMSDMIEKSKPVPKYPEGGIPTGGVAYAGKQGNEFVDTRTYKITPLPCSNQSHT